MRDGFLFRPIGLIRVVGVDTGVRVYEIVGKAADATEEQRQCTDSTQRLYDAFLAGTPASFVSGANFIVDGAITTRVQY